MEKNLAFFRVFDLAFFLPGMVTLLHLSILGYYLDWHAILPKQLPDLFVKVPTQIALIFFVIGVIFFWGMLLHAITRWLHDFGHQQDQEQIESNVKDREHDKKRSIPFGKWLMLCDEHAFEQETQAFRRREKDPK